MRVGVVFPQLEIGTDPARIRYYVEAVEDLGYGHLVAFDHVLGATRDRPGGDRFSYDERSLFHEPLVLFGWLAAFTKLELGTAVIVLPQRQTALVAKQAAEVDVLTRGRLRLGVGIGWNFVEYEALGEKFTNRGRRIEEQIALLRRLWTEEVVDFKGRWHRVDRAGLNPLPVQRPIPVWMGGNADPAMERIARLADGYFTHLQPTEAGLAQLERFHGFLRKAGRDPTTFPIEGRVTVASLADPDEWVRTGEAFRDLGFTHLEISTLGAKLATLDDHIATLRRFRDDAKGLFG